MEYAEPTRLTASAEVYGSPCVLVGFLIATDGGNSPAVTAYNDIDASTAGNKIMPPVVVSSDSQEFVGFFPALPILCRTALYVNISDLGTGEVFVYWRPK